MVPATFAEREGGKGTEARAPEEAADGEPASKARTGGRPFRPGGDCLCYEPEADPLWLAPCYDDVLRTLRGRPAVVQAREEDVMRRSLLLLSLVVALLVGVVAIGRLSTTAQEAGTPPPTGGVTSMPLGGGQPAAAPGRDLTLRRIIIPAGEGIGPHTHPGALVIFVEAGEFGYTRLGGEARLARAAVAGTPVATEELPLGTEVVLQPGDWLFVEDPADAVRAVGGEPVVLIVAGLTEEGEPFTTLLEGTPTAATPAA